MSLHSVLVPGAVAVVTGGASGIGLAAAHRFVSLGLRVAILDLAGETLSVAETLLGEVAAEAGGEVLAIATDVSDVEAVRAAETAVRIRWGAVDVLMNNAGIQPGSAVFGPLSAWQRVISVNLMGVVNGVQCFVPAMVASGRPGLVINTGSKQGITTPPGDPAYNVAKAGVKVLTEALQHELRTTAGCAVTAHLLVPGFVFTPLTARGRVEKPAGAWTPAETIDFMMAGLAAGDFYILCPDGEVTRAMDEKRIAWAAGDLIENRPPLSRWHPDWADAYKAFLEE